MFHPVLSVVSSKYFPECLSFISIVYTCHANIDILQQTTIIPFPIIFQFLRILNNPKRSAFKIDLI